MTATDQDIPGLPYFLPFLAGRQYFDAANTLSLCVDKKTNWMQNRNLREAGVDALFVHSSNLCSSKPQAGPRPLILGTLKYEIGPLSGK